MTEDDGRAGGRPPGGSNRRRGSETLLAHAAATCGMTYDELAGYLDLRPATVRAYAAGARPTPARVLEAMATLIELVTMRQPLKPGVVLPPAAQARREALEAMRRRAWPKPELATTRLNPHAQKAADGDDVDDDEDEDGAGDED